MTNKEKTIRWFESIADECDKLTSGNVAHLRAQIKGMAIRSAEYLQKHSQEPASEDFEAEWKRYCDSKGGGVVTMNIKDVAKHFAEWQKEQMLKDAVIIEDELVMCYNNGEPMGLSPYKEWWETPEVQIHFKDGDKVKVIIVKDND